MTLPSRLTSLIADMISLERVSCLKLLIGKQKMSQRALVSIKTFLSTGIAIGCIIPLLVLTSCVMSVEEAKSKFVRSCNNSKWRELASSKVPLKSMRLQYQIIFPRPDFDLTNQVYDDAFSPAEDLDSAELPFRCAIADGAKITRSAGAWARALVDYFVDPNSSLEGIRAKWIEQDLPQKPRVAFAAVVAILFEEQSTGHGKWHATGIGDSCFAQIRDGKLHNSFPIGPDYDFKLGPTLLASTTPINDHHQQKASGSFKTGDTFLLMTDGFAKFLLPGMKNGTYIQEMTQLAQSQLWEWTHRACLQHRAKSKTPYDASLVKVTIIS